MNWPNIFLFCFAVGSVWALAAVLMGGFRFAHFGHGHLHFGHGHVHAGHIHGQLAHPHGSVVHSNGSAAKAPAGQHGGLWGHLVNPSCIAVFLAWFGAAGYVLERHSGLQLWMDLSVASGAGLVGATILARFMAALQNNERVMDPADYEMAGTLGQVGATIRPGGVGEILYVRDGARKAVPAKSEDGVVIERGSEVIVLRYEKGIAYVRTWDAMTQ
jgi:membrane protein implicated in regulation of membrane protease activity